MYRIINCPQCQQKLKIPEVEKALLVHCPNCKKSFTVEKGSTSKTSSIIETVKETLSISDLNLILHNPHFWLIFMLAALPILLEMFADISFMFMYFSFIWIFIFYKMFRIQFQLIKPTIIAYFITAFFIMPLFSFYLAVPPQITESLLNTDSRLLNLLGFFSVGIREELFKALFPMLIIFLPRYFYRYKHYITPKNCMFFCMVCGISFAAVENIYYLNKFLRFDKTYLADKPLSYVGSISRSMLTPFIHASLSGIFGYFLGRATQYRLFRRDIFIAGLVISAFLHGIYDFAVSFNNQIIVLSVLLYIFYVFIKLYVQLFHIDYNDFKTNL